MVGPDEEKLALAPPSLTRETLQYTSAFSPRCSDSAVVWPLCSESPPSAIHHCDYASRGILVVMTHTNESRGTIMDNKKAQLAPGSVPIGKNLRMSPSYSVLKNWFGA